MHPRVEVTVDGEPVAGAFYERLISVTVTDEEGLKSDSFDLELTDGSPDFLAIPRKGALVSIKMGFGKDLIDKGEFTVDKIDLDCLPYKMSISGKAADLRAGKLKERQERSWDKATIGDIVGQIAGESGLTPALDPDLASHKYEWIGQQDESNIHFLRRLAERHNALFAVKQRRILFTRLGSGLSASGAALGSIILTPEKIKLGSMKVEVNDRTKYSKVIAYYQDKDKAKRIEVEADGDADGDSIFRIPEPYASPAEADKAAQSKAKDLQRGEGGVSVTAIGDAGISAGLPLLFADVRPGVDGVPYIIKTAKTTYSKSGLEVAVTGRLYDGKSATEGDKSSSGSPATPSGDATTTAGKVAPNSAPGTPATPSQFLTPRRYGRTDEN